MSKLVRVDLLTFYKTKQKDKENSTFCFYFPGVTNRIVRLVTPGTLQVWLIAKTYHFHLLLKYFWFFLKIHLEIIESIIIYYHSIVLMKKTKIIEWKGKTWSMYFLTLQNNKLGIRILTENWNIVNKSIL